MSRDPIPELKRQLEADPQNGDLALALLHARARVEGEAAYLEPLNNRELWNNSSELVQDLAIKAVANSLAADFSHAHTRLYQCGPQRHRIATFFHHQSGAELNLLPGGRFLMGSHQDEAWAEDREQPQHPVHIEAPFLIGRTPLQQREWERVFRGMSDALLASDKPMDDISWNFARLWLKKAGSGLRLPSEAEWEYACRAGSQSRYFWGSDMDSEYCWHLENSDQRSHSMSEHQDKLNAFGLVDMLGNVSEWCHDDFIDDYRDGPDTQRPRTTQSNEKVVRGGSWSEDAIFCRSAERGAYWADHSGDVYGFRLARSLDL